MNKLFSFMQPEKKITEQESAYDNLERMSLEKILQGISREDHKVAPAVAKAIPSIKKLTAAVLRQMKKGGRLFYVGAGTSGRLGIVDASECPPTYGVPHGLIIGLIAGGDKAIRKAVEFAEDDFDGGWKDLKKYGITRKDFVIGIAASGTTPYVVGTLHHCRMNKIKTGCITCNPDTPLSRLADYPVEVITGPEFVTGSTRMKAGTAQKLVLNMISTAVMIKMGRVKGNKMVDMQLTNNKLITRGMRMLMNALNVSAGQAARLLRRYGGVRKALQHARA
jgi:N-acetylmuramic acid 6-phosphate etherase